MEEEKKWYVVKVHSGFEQAVKFSIEQAIESLGLQDVIFEIVIPVEKRIRIKGGKKVEKEDKIFPGFILVNMMITDKSWYTINNIEHVSGFLGSRSYAESVSEEEINEIKARMQNDNIRHETDLNVGDAVKIIEGPFEDLDGKIAEIDPNKGQIVVMIKMFGRETPVKLDLFQVRTI